MAKKKMGGMNVPCAMTIAGSDSGGGAGIAADLKTFAALGVHGLCVVTAVTAQNTRGVDSVLELPPRFVTRQLDTVMRDFEVEWAKTGMLSSAGIVRAVEAGVRRHGLRLVVDPVMASATGSPLLREDASAAFARLISRSELVTPNLHEAEKLSGIKIKSVGDMRKAARIIARLGPQAVLVKGGHMKGASVVDLMYSGGKFREFRGARIPGGPAHGTGCSFSSAIVAELAKGAVLEDAVARGKEFVEMAIASRLDVGKGIRPANQMASQMMRAEKGRAIEEVLAASRMLVDDPRFVNLIPEVGSNIAMALPWAEDVSEVVGLSGRMVRSGGRAVMTGLPELGGSEHVANFVLTAMRHDPNVRAGMNVRFSPDVLKACKGLGLEIGTFDRSREPRGKKTMEWGTGQAIRKAGRVPQVIFDRGAVGKEPMVRLFGASPVDVAGLALRLAGKLGRSEKFYRWTDEASKAERCKWER